MLSDAELNEIKDETAFVSHQTMEDVFTQAALANQLQAQLAKARSDAASPIYSADVLEKCAKPEGGFTDRDRKMHQHGFYCGVEEASESIRAAKDKP
jgi:hypothetical protein